MSRMMQSSMKKALVEEIETPQTDERHESLLFRDCKFFDDVNGGVGWFQRGRSKDVAHGRVPDDVRFFGSKSIRSQGQTRTSDIHPMRGHQQRRR